MNELERLNLKIKRCKKCNLWKFRKNAVPGEGLIDAKIFFGKLLKLKTVK